VHDRYCKPNGREAQHGVVGGFQSRCSGLAVVRWRGDGELTSPTCLRKRKSPGPSTYNRNTVYEARPETIRLANDDEPKAALIPVLDTTGRGQSCPSDGVQYRAAMLARHSLRHVPLYCGYLELKNVDSRIVKRAFLKEEGRFREGGGV